MKSLPYTIEDIRIQMADAVATTSERSAEEQRVLLADLLARAFEATTASVAG